MTRRPPHDRDDVDTFVPADAADWLVRSHSDQRTRDDEESLHNWLSEAPENAAEYRAMDGLWREMRELGSDPFARAVLRDEPEPPSEPVLLTRRRMLAAGGGLAALAAAASFGLFMLYPQTGDIYETAIGEQRRLQLADGSSVTLNTDTRLRVLFSETERWLELEQGQAWFQVAHDPARPFRVFVGNDEVRALGTAFEVRKIGDHARVILEQGVVGIYRGANRAPAQTLRQQERQSSAGARAPDLLLRPGQAATVADGPQIVVAQVDIPRAQAWRSGRVVLDEDRLADAVAEINRYGARQIVIADPSLAELRVSGVFHTARPETFVDAITQAFPIEAQRTPEDGFALSAR